MSPAAAKISSREKFTTDRAIPWITGTIAMLVTLLTQIFSRRPDFHPSLLLNIASTDPIAKYVSEADPSFKFSPSADHYDGLYYWAMAADPFASGRAHDLIDLAAYRYGHPFYAWLGGLLAFGQKSAFDTAFWLLSLASMFAAAVAVSLLAKDLGGSPWWGLLVVFSPGLLFSASTALTEPFQVALIAGLILAFRKNAHPLVLAVLSFAMCLTKEQLVLVVGALYLVLIKRVFDTRKIDWVTSLSLLTGPIALFFWRAYIATKFSDEQKHYDDGNLGTPLKGWLETFDYAGAMRGGDMSSSQIGSTTVPGLMAIAALLIVAAVIGLMLFDELGLTVALQAGLISCLGWRTLLYPHELYRIPSVAVLFAALLVGLWLASRGRGERAA